MKHTRLFFRQKGQSAVEYAIIVAAATAALIIMGTYVRRAVQANLKQTELAINGSVAESNDGGGGSGSGGGSGGSGGSILGDILDQIGDTIDDVVPPGQPVPGTGPQEVPF